MTPHDIEKREDIDLLLVKFYETAMTDLMIGHHFSELDLVTHLPVIGDFWEAILFARPLYYGNPLLVHQQLHTKNPLKPEHFYRWVEIFRAKVDSMFRGERADLAKLRAGIIAGNLDQRLNPSLLPT